MTSTKVQVLSAGKLPNICVQLTALLQLTALPKISVQLTALPKKSYLEDNNCQLVLHM